MRLTTARLASTKPALLNEDLLVLTSKLISTFLTSSEIRGESADCVAQPSLAGFDDTVTGPR